MTTWREHKATRQIERARDEGRLLFRKRLRPSIWLLALFLVLAIGVAFSSRLLEAAFPAYIAAAFGFVVAAIGRNLLFAMMGQNLSVDDKLFILERMKYIVVRNRGYVNVLELKIFFEIYENNRENSEVDDVTLLHTETVAVSSIAAAMTASVNKEHVLYAVSSREDPWCLGTKSPES